jgi:hypothetical protein
VGLWVTKRFWQQLGASSFSGAPLFWGGFRLFLYGFRCGFWFRGDDGRGLLGISIYVLGLDSVGNLSGLGNDAGMGFGERGMVLRCFVCGHSSASFLPLHAMPSLFWHSAAQAKLPTGDSEEPRNFPRL